MIVVGVDPSLTNFGMAKGCLRFEGNQPKFQLQELRLQTTSSSSDKKLRKNMDDFDRAQLLVRALGTFAVDADLIIAEFPVGSQSARAMTSYAFCVMLLACVNERVPVIPVMPDELKLSVIGDKKATKQQIIDWATNLYPHANWITKKRHGVVTYTDANEHLADAVGAIHAGIASDLFKQLMLFRKT